MLYKFKLEKKREFDSKRGMVRTNSMTSRMSRWDSIKEKNRGFDINWL